MGWIDELDIARPCKASWNQMAGDDRVRFCGECKKNVYDLDALGKAEARALVDANEGELCVRFLRRPDGHILTSQCQERPPLWSSRSLRVLAAGATLTLLPSCLMGAPPKPRPRAAAADGAQSPDLGTSK